MKVSIGKIRIDNNDGTWTELNFEMPHKVADDILCQIIDWKNDYEMTFNQWSGYVRDSQAFNVEIATRPQPEQSTGSQDVKQD